MEVEGYRLLKVEGWRLKVKGSNLQPPTLTVNNFQPTLQGMPRANNRLTLNLLTLNLLTLNLLTLNLLTLNKPLRHNGETAGIYIVILNYIQLGWFKQPIIASINLALES